MPSHDRPLTTESRLHEAVLRFNAGDESATEDLIGHVRRRLMVLTRRRLRQSGGFTKVARWHETEDITQEALIRLADTLRKEPINSGDHFLRLAAQHIRWTLLNIHAHVTSKAHSAVFVKTDPNQPKDGGPDRRLSTARARTDTAFRWDKFMDHFKTLTAEQRTMLDLLFFNGCTQQETADHLKIGITTFKDRWRKLKLQLNDEGFAPFN